MRNALSIRVWLLVASICILLCGAFFYLRQEKSQSKLSKKQLYSFLVGHELYRQLKEYQPNHDLAHVIEGMRACENELPLPDTMSDEQKAKFLNEMEYELFHESNETNRAKAASYLLSIDKEALAITCIPLKLYYQILREGTGSDLLQPESTAVFHYSITTLDNKEVFTTRNRDPIEVNLTDAIPGFSQGVIGMKENERRKIIIHPDLAYGSTSWHVPPQSLLIIDVELCSLSRKE